MQKLEREKEPGAGEKACGGARAQADGPPVAEYRRVLHKYYQRPYKVDVEATEARVFRGVFAEHLSGRRLAETDARLLDLLLDLTQCSQMPAKRSTCLVVPEGWEAVASSIVRWNGRRGTLRSMLYSMFWRTTHARARVKQGCGKAGCLNPLHMALATPTATVRLLKRKRARRAVEEEISVDCGEDSCSADEDSETPPFSEYEASFESSSGFESDDDATQAAWGAATGGEPPPKRAKLLPDDEALCDAQELPPTLELISFEQMLRGARACGKAAGAKEDADDPAAAEEDAKWFYWDAHGCPRMLRVTKGELDRVHAINIF